MPVVYPNENSLDDALKVLNSAYHEAIRFKKKALQDLKDYETGKYGLADDGSRIVPKIENQYRVWFRTVGTLLGYAVVPSRVRHDFMLSEAPNNLDEALSLEASQGQRLIQGAYDKSLEALSIALDDLRGVDRQIRKVVSLFKTELNLYLHIEPDNTDVKLHEFRRNSSLDAMLEYIFSHPDEVIPAERLKFESQGYNSKRDIPEDLRTASITAELKKLFFPVCNADEIKFVSRSEISQTELSTLLAGLKPSFRQ